MSAAPDAIEQVARYLQERSRVGDRGWDAISERGRELYRQRAREIAAILARPTRSDNVPLISVDARAAIERVAEVRDQAADLLARTAKPNGDPR